MDRFIVSVGSIIEITLALVLGYFVWCHPKKYLDFHKKYYLWVKKISPNFIQGFVDFANLLPTSKLQLWVDRIILILLLFIGLLGLWAVFYSPYLE